MTQRCFTLADETGRGTHGPLSLTEAQWQLQKRAAVGYYKRPVYLWTCEFDPVSHQLTVGERVGGAQ